MQIFKPVSPLAWLPIVTMVVSAVYVSSDPWLAEVVRQLGDHGDALLAVARADQHGARRREHRQGPHERRPRAAARLVHASVSKIVLPSALPLIFTGLRLSLGVGWMVLIAAEMLAQNPGLGKFVWDEFQNGSSESLARILVAVFTIGVIGFLLDRIDARAAGRRHAHGEPLSAGA